MPQKAIILLFLGYLFYSCSDKKIQQSDLLSSGSHKWSIEALNQKASDHLDSTKRDNDLFKQDIETYAKYPEVFQSYPLNKSPFPVAEYDYAVSYVPITIIMDGKVFKGVKVGECEDPDCEKVIDKLTLLVLTNDEEAEELTMVDSRNFPYLTAQGYVKFSNHEYEWTFSASPDGFSTLLLNMKLFDLRFGETVLIYPQSDNSFLYDQIKDSPNNYASLDQFEKSILANERVKSQLKSERNIK
jgi:hypothetical protein|tara:strand:- start:9230 stop:9958 length:729 start_codon:yes stop_codon:yes gene_type:complete